MLNRESVRLLTGTRGAGPVAITTKGPTEVDTYSYCETENSWCVCG